MASKVSSVLLIGVFASAAFAAIPDVYLGCGVSKGCFGLPDGCLDTQSCSVVSSFAKYDELSMVFEIYGTAYVPDASYIAVGFSEDMRMNNDSVTECQVLTGVVDIFQSANQPDDPDLLHRNRRLSNNKLGLTLLNGLYEDGKLYCQFTRETVLTINTVVYDLTNDYYLLMAAGLTTATGVREHGDGIHGLSSELVDFDAFTATRAVDPRLRRKEQLPEPSITSENFYDGCGTTKGCFGTPRYCESTKDCKVIMSYKKADDENYEFEVFGELFQPDNSYVAIGFSFDSLMENDSVTECVMMGGNFNLYHSYNRPIVGDYLSNRRLKETEQSGHSLLESSIVDGSMYCRFTRANVKVIEGIEFDLRKEWYILIASGPARADNLLTHDEGYASHTRSAVSLDTPAIPVTTTPVPSTDHPVYTGCAETKGCFGHPNHCVASHSCNMLVTYRNATDTQFEFELYGFMYTGRAAGSYVAIGFSNDRAMDDDSVTECFSVSGTIDVAMSYNKGHDNVRSDDPHLGLELMEASEADGYLYCKFLRDNVIEHNGKSFDIATNNYHLFLAAGPADLDKIHEHHDLAASDDKVSLSDFKEVKAREVSALITWHGIFMTVAWMFLVSIGTFLPKYHRQSWPGKELFHSAMWFSLHRMFTGFAVFFTLYAFIVIFIAEAGWVNSENPVSIAHAVLGIIITVLTFLQPFGTFLRPAPDHPKRWIFNLCHAGVGYCIYFLAVVNMYLGAVIRDGIEPWAQWIVVTFAVVYLLSHVAHFIFRRSTSDSASTQDIIKDQKRKVAPVEVVWYCYVACALGLTIAVIVALA